PARFAARTSHDVRTLDLSRLASGDANSEIIYPGDSLAVAVVTGAEEEPVTPWNLTVSEDGLIDVPIIGQVQVAGQSLVSAERMLRQAAIDRQLYRSPSVSVMVAERRTNRITVTGAVEEPGIVELPTAGSDLLAAIVAAGGLTDAADRFVEIKRSTPFGPTFMANQPGVQQASYASGEPVGDPSSTTVDLISAVAQPNPAGYRISDGDVIVVREKPARFIHVLGLVNKPDQFEVPAHQNITLLNAISMAGGLTSTLADRVVIVRQLSEAEEPITISASIKDAKEDPELNLLLADGDVISVEETPVTFLTTAVTTMIRFGINGATF
ncbi:MAG: SLBB domain-containing protein, partial [Planctomycetota bacterium]